MEFAGRNCWQWKGIELAQNQNVSVNMNESEAEDDPHFTPRCEDYSLLALQPNADRRTDLALQRTATDGEQTRLELGSYGGKSLES